MTFTVSRAPVVHRRRPPQLPYVHPHRRTVCGLAVGRCQAAGDRLVNGWLNITCPDCLSQRLVPQGDPA